MRRSVCLPHPFAGIIQPSVFIQQAHLRHLDTLLIPHIVLWPLLNTSSGPGPSRRSVNKEFTTQFVPGSWLGSSLGTQRQSDSLILPEEVGERLTRELTF